MFKFSKRVKDAEPSVIREMLKLSLDPSYISFAGGDPDPELFPELPQAETDKMDLQYGISEGDPKLRKAIAKYMNNLMNTNGANTPKRTETSDNILITTGSQQGLDLTGKLFIDEGDTIIVERPTYMGAINAFKQYDPNFIDIESDAEGMDAVKLEECLKANPETKFIYVIPDFQNPGGTVMSLARRKKLVELANKYEIYIIEDSPYYELRYDGENIPTIRSMDENGFVIYLGSFSKTVCPGLRTGWIDADADPIEQYVILKQAADIHTNSTSQLQLTKFLNDTDLDAHFKTIRDSYREKRDAIVDAIDAEFPDLVAYRKPEGGLFVWVELPKDWVGEDLMEECIKEKVAIIPGSRFYVNDPEVNTIRLSFATMDPDRIKDGIKRIKKAMRNYESSRLSTEFGSKLIL